jgi:hypothetical protein
MKITTQKILLFFHAGGGEEFWLSNSEFENLLPQLTNEGRRSLLYLLKKNHFLKSRKIDKTLLFSITPKGLATLKRLFPFIFLEGDGVPQQQACVIFLHPPAADPHFRQLRKHLLELGSHALQRGIFLFSQGVPETLLVELQENYFDSILVLSIHDWLIKNKYLFIDDEKHFVDVKNTLSGISREVMSLTEKNILFSSRNHQHNLAIHSSFERIFLLLLSEAKTFSLSAELKAELQIILKELKTLFRSEREK